MREFTHLVFMGRFQPLHNGHLHIIERALQLADRVVILVGSANLARSPRNPFTYQERARMIETAIPGIEDAQGRVIVRPVSDHPYNDKAWIAEVQACVHNVVLGADNPSPSVTLHGLRDYKVGLIGHKKDGTSYYLKMFPEWKSVDVPTAYSTLSATDLRAQYLQPAPQVPDIHLVPTPVRGWLARFITSEPFKWLVGEQKFYEAYRRSWAASPYPPFIQTVDPVVVQSGHILLVRRGQHPGLGLLALPGGHPNVDEALRQAAIRELREETRISDSKGELPPAMLSSFIEDKKTRVFDAPHRSERGRVITQAYLFTLPDRTELFSVRGGDDAASATWHPLGSLCANEFFEDHAAIIEEMTGCVLKPDWEV